jgi:hypothetical protein
LFGKKLGVVEDRLVVFLSGLKLAETENYIYCLIGSNSGILSLSISFSHTIRSSDFGQIFDMMLSFHIHKKKKKTKDAQRMTI